MQSHHELNDQEFEAVFAASTLDPSLFSHEAHLRLAWIHIKKYSLEQAEENIQTQILRYVKHLGAEDKYHTTITIAAINAVNHFLKRSKTEDFKAFIAENPKLMTDFKALIDSHYSFDVFGSEAARIQYIKPDKQDFF